VLTILGLLLLGLLAWMLWWWLLLPAVHFVALPIVGYDLLAVPPLKFPAEDVEAFSRLPRRGEAVVLADLQTSQAIATVNNRLQGLAARHGDTLIFYLRGYGMSDDGKAWVLCSDYLRTADGGRFPLADLLGQIERCPAAKKLLILDTGELPADPRLGMIVNEFAQLLEAEVRRVNDRGLWVLVSHRPLEAPHVSETADRTAFGYFVTEGLAGAADRNGDGTVELHELVEYVRRGVAGWVERESGGAETQTPWLLHGGEGSADAPAGVTLLPVSGFGRKGAGNREGRVSRAAAANTAGPEQAAGSPRQAATQVAALLEEAWRLRDRIEQSPTAAGLTPIDYAPHLWRAYQELLLGYELRLRGGREYDPAKLADDLRTFRGRPSGDRRSPGRGPTSFPRRLQGGTAR
jgi:hypothetical protein